MSDELWGGLSVIAAAVIGLALVSTLVSSKAQTGQVITSAAGGLGYLIGEATSPVTGVQAQLQNTSLGGSVQ